MTPITKEWITSIYYAFHFEWYTFFFLVYFDFSAFWYALLQKKFCNKSFEHIAHIQVDLKNDL